MWFTSHFPTLERQDHDIIQSLEKQAEEVKESGKMVGDRLAADAGHHLLTNVASIELDISDKVTQRTVQSTRLRLGQNESKT